MYYSNEGVSFDRTVKACNRQNLFTNVVNSTDLFTETSRFAYVLSLRQITVYIPVEEMERITHAAVTAFMDYVCKYVFVLLINTLSALHSSKLNKLYLPTFYENLYVDYTKTLLDLHDY